MDGNESGEENDFVEALTEEMPVVEQEMADCLSKIDECDELLD